VFWVACGALSALWLQRQPFGNSNFAPNLLLIALLPLWVGDSLAYFVGKAIGKHKLAPSISPNKTWEGAIANLVGCLAAAYAIGSWLQLPVAASIAVGLTTGMIGQVGDLLQSRIKRLANVKDSGSILPGHGGVLDRLDSFLFSAYPSLLALWLLAPEAFHVKQWPW
jgi:phosphatidate cytidylyltransferase